MKKRKPPKGITRIEIPARNTFGWMVRIMRGKQHPHEFFADKKHGGKKKAEQAAKAYYKELDLSMPPPMSTKNLMNKRNNSGKVGVHISVNVDRRQTKEYVYWCWTSQWIDKEETRKSKTFSWIRYGDELAHELACIARDNETQDMEKIKKAYKKIKKKELQI